jgi:hypothetical protein
MKFCKCGGLMTRRDTTYLKTTKEYKVRLRCKDCKTFESHYYDQLPEFRAKRGIGRPWMVEQR